MNDLALRCTLKGLPPRSRDALRRAARAAQWERDELAGRPMREPNGQLMADLIDHLSLDDHARRQMVRVLGELEADS